MLKLCHAEGLLLRDWQTCREATQHWRLDYTDSCRPSFSTHWKQRHKEAALTVNSFQIKWWIYDKKNNRQNICKQRKKKFWTDSFVKVVGCLSELGPIIDPNQEWDCWYDPLTTTTLTLTYSGSFPGYGCNRVSEHVKVHVIFGFVLFLALEDT